jgi:hypothetical protein
MSGTDCENHTTRVSWLTVMSGSERAMSRRATPESLFSICSYPEHEFYVFQIEYRRQEFCEWLRLDDAFADGIANQSRSVMDVELVHHI